jgi:hypothetical protein
MFRRRKASPVDGKDDDGVILASVISTPVDEKLNKLPISSCRRYWRILLGIHVFLLIVAYSVFVIFRRTLRSRPAWLYGEPMLVKDLSACLEPAASSASVSPLPPPQVLWEWHNYTTTSTTTNNNNNSNHHPNVLIAQYSGFGDYAKFLNLISPMHQHYAKRHGYDYVILQGTLLHIPGILHDCHPNPRATFDKIPLLSMALSLREKYDYVLILDTDAMIVDLDNIVEWSKILPSDQLLAAQRVWKYDWKNSWDINAGVTLWNLHHPEVETVLNRWTLLSQHGSENGSSRDHRETILTKNDDQYFLQTALLETFQWWNRPLVSVTQEFNYYEGTVVKHFKRDKRSWSTNGLEQRLERVQETIRQVCAEHAEYCPATASTDFMDYSRRRPPSSKH